jgi:hypothetical protein
MLAAEQLLSGQAAWVALPRVHHGKKQSYWATVLQLRWSGRQSRSFYLCPAPPRHHSWYSHNGSPCLSLLLIDQVHVRLYLLARGCVCGPNHTIIVPRIHASLLIQCISNLVLSVPSTEILKWITDFHTSKTIYINETPTLVSKTEFFISFSNITMTNFDLQILEKYIFIPCSRYIFQSYGAQICSIYLDCLLSRLIQCCQLYKFSPGKVFTNNGYVLVQNTYNFPHLSPPLKKFTVGTFFSEGDLFLIWYFLGVS